MNKDHGNRIPGDEVKNFHTWKIPEIEGGKVLPSAERELRERREREARAKGEVIGESVDTHEYSGPITAAELAKITEQAHREGYAAGFEQGHAEGFKTGSQEGQNKAYAEVKTALDANLTSVAKIIDGLTDPFETHTQALQQLLEKTVMSLAASVVQRDIQSQPLEIHRLIEEAIAALPKSASNITICLHPDDITFLEESLPHKAQLWSLRADPGLTRGGVVIQTKDSLIDFSIDRQLKMLEEKWLRGELSVTTDTNLEQSDDQNRNSETTSADQPSKNGDDDASLQGDV